MTPDLERYWTDVEYHYFVQWIGRALLCAFRPDLWMVAQRGYRLTEQYYRKYAFHEVNWHAAMKMAVDEGLLG